MVSRKPFYLLVALLYIVGLGMTFYHHIALDVPLTPGEKRQIWSSKPSWSSRPPASR